MKLKIRSSKALVVLLLWMGVVFLGNWLNHGGPLRVTQTNPDLTTVQALFQEFAPPTSGPQFQLASTATTRINVLQPKYELSWADPTNYGERYGQDINGNPVYNLPIIVLHETVGSADSAINFFQTPHPNEDDQASYHTLIRLDGTVIYIVPPEKRAFGAGNSVFDGANGPEAVKTHKIYPASVNNFAYHVSLETPPSGRNNAYHHSGYTEAQYQSLAWLIAQSTVPDERITTHRSVDRSGERIDPRSFDMDKFLNLLHQRRTL